jgi:Fic-DOC domain mobile mystery protein B
MGGGNVKKIDFPEGATPIPECSGLIPNWVQTLSDLNRVEATNILSAQTKYLRKPNDGLNSWFRIEELKKIHRAMFGEVWNWAGQFRKEVTSIGIKPALIPSAMVQLCFEVCSWRVEDFTILEKGARIRHKLVFIHPFENGNGRFSRLVADRYLLAHGCSHPLWPIELNKEGQYRKNYIQALKNADKGNYAPLLEFMREFGAG